MILNMIPAISALYQNIEAHQQLNNRRYDDDEEIERKLEPPTLEEFEKSIHMKAKYNWSCECGEHGVFNPSRFPRGFKCPVCGSDIELTPTKHHPYYRRKLNIVNGES